MDIWLSQKLYKKNPHSGAFWCAMYKQIDPMLFIIISMSYLKFCAILSDRSWDLSIPKNSGKYIAAPPFDDWFPTKVVKTSV